MRRRIRITESQLRRTVNEAVRGLLRENEEDDEQIGKDGFYPHGVIRFVMDIDDDDLYDDSYIDWADDPDSFDEIDWNTFEPSEEGVYALTREGQREIEHEKRNWWMNDYQRSHSFGYGKPKGQWELFQELISDPYYSVPVE